jgi:metallo-beta-lactamase family protein
MKLSFHGAAQGVTGSCHLVECAGRRILVDCGLYQGGREIDEENEEPFGFDATAIDVVLLTHAHLDHCGRLPLLVRRGFRGGIVATAATRELAQVVLLDAARLQEEEAERRGRHAGGRDGHHGAGAPLYTVADAHAAHARIDRVAAYGAPIEVVPGAHATFVDAGHILGSASIDLALDDGARTLRIAFSGDLGNAGRPLLRDPVPPAGADVVVMETTYGDRLHRPLAASVDEFVDAVADTFRRGGNVIVPTFALERAQELLYVLRQAVESDRLPRHTPVFLDSPMAISATEIFRRHPEACSDAVAAMLRAGDDPFALPGLRFTRDASESMAINRISGGAVILAGSGMATGGRVRHHLRHHLARRESSVVLVGFAARGTLARRLVDGAHTVTLFGEEVPVRARIHTINGFSAHADRDELLAWHRQVGARRTFLVHGEPEVAERFAEALTDTEVERPAPGQGFEL